MVLDSETLATIALPTATLCAMWFRLERRIYRVELKLENCRACPYSTPTEKPKRPRPLWLLALVLAISALFLVGCATGNRTRATTGQSTSAAFTVNAAGTNAVKAAETLSASFQAASSTGASDTNQKPMTAAQRVGAIVGTTGGVILAGVIVLAVLSPSTLLMFFARRYLATRAALSETVAAIKHSNAVNENAKLHDALVAAQSPTTRALVEQVKRDA